MPYYHAKEEVLKGSKAKKKWPEKYHGINIFMDISLYTLKKRREFQSIITLLREHRIAYHWGYTVKMLVHSEGKIKVIFSPAEGQCILREWNIAELNTVDPP
ncbi:Hypothetical predicted protein [Pelobates cultripes]|uniref:Uncharacterized protein n=1 Tax=Pelobates cultripes TaxID=61616 RepID=A0AAD1TBE6_PELCU|nr:Hypothetical predicted protein [Pelobates cultripes]